MILLDTCALLWLALDQSQLSATARQTLAAHAGRLWVSPITAFEIGQTAIELLVQMIESKRPVTDFQTKVLETNLIIRESSIKEA